jgi:hypothetical protein
MPPSSKRSALGKRAGGALIVRDFGKVMGGCRQRFGLSDPLDRVTDLVQMGPVLGAGRPFGGKGLVTI